jgi:Zn-dependent peptidase ImmA (M78 family)
MELCEKAGQFLLVTDSPGQGASVRDGDVAVAVVSRRLDPGRRRSTAAHELGHLVLGDEYSTDLGVSASRSDREAAIDAFASELLLPTDVVAGLAGARHGDMRERLVRTAATYRTSWSLVVNQALHAQLIDPPTKQQLLRKNPTRVEFMDAVGWVPQPDLESVRVPPLYAHAVVESWRRGLITRTRAVELMHGQIEDSDLPVLDDTDSFP